MPKRDRSKQEALRLGIRVRPIQHSMQRRAVWKAYWQRGVYGITIHLHQYEDGTYEECTLLSNIVGTSNVHDKSNPDFPHPELTALGKLVEKKIKEIGTHPNEENVVVTNYVIMPTHIHLTVEVHDDLPMITRGKHPERYHLGRIIGYLKSGTTGWYRRLLQGESMENILARPNWRDVQAASASSTPPCPSSSSRLSSDVHNQPAAAFLPSLWNPGFNDKILTTSQRRLTWNRYVDMNPYFWRIQDEHPRLFEHRLHLHLSMNDGELIDFSAYGCMFLLRKGERIQVMCHRLARKGMLTADEWTRISTLDTNGRYAIAHKYEEDRKTKPLGRWDRRWLYSTDPACITPIPYPETEHFRSMKTQLLSLAENGTILVSPAISEGEQEIMYGAVALNCPVIKLSDKPFTDKHHPVNKDRLLCAQGLMLVLAPWEIPASETSNNIPANTDYSRFHNMNKLAERMCDDIDGLKLVKEYEE